MNAHVGVLVALVAARPHPALRLVVLRALARRELLAARDPWWETDDENGDSDT